MKARRTIAIAAASFLGGISVATAAEVHAEMRQATPSGPGDLLGTVTISDSASGVVFKTALKGLPPGLHGFHVHEKGSCQPSTADGKLMPAGGAGGHYDPQQTGKHEGPSGAGHLGDLPVLQVTADGTSNQSLTAPHIRHAEELHGKSLIIHAGGDNYSDQPLPLGGGGARIACGLID
jgi:Cu-Zn family superoxide dismutase